MKVKDAAVDNTAESDISMGWTWNILMFVSFNLAIGASLAILDTAETLARTAVLTVLPFITMNIVMVKDYADIISYPGVAIISFLVAWFFAKALKEKMRRAFNWLARGGFWYSVVIFITNIILALGSLVNNLIS